MRPQSRRAKPAPEAPRARQQAVARPSIVSGGGGGRSSTIIGVRIPGVRIRPQAVV